MFPYSVTVTVERPTGEDRHGNPLEPEVHTVEGCVFAPAGEGIGAVGSERSGDSSRIEWDLDLINQDAHADFGSDDIVIRPGDPTRYEVYGVPLVYGPHPWSGWEAGVVVRLKGVRG